MRFVQTLDILSRLALVNVRFGPLLNTIFETLDENTQEIQLPESVWSWKNDFYFQRSRGKLTAYGYSTSVFSEMPFLVGLGILMYVLRSVLECFGDQDKNGHKRTKLLKVKGKLNALIFFYFGLMVLDL